LPSPTAAASSGDDEEDSAAKEDGSEGLVPITELTTVRVHTLLEHQDAGNSSAFFVRGKIKNS
jgi:hypothetical protein